MKRESILLKARRAATGDKEFKSMQQGFKEDSENNLNHFPIFYLDDKFSPVFKRGSSTLTFLINE